MQPDSARRFPLNAVYAPSLAGKPLPERQWIVPGWIPSRAVTMLNGDGGVGKSLVALQLMVSCALGRPWLGLPTKRMKTFALFCEDDQAEVHLRLNDIARSEGVEFDDLEGVGWAARSGLENVLMAFGQQEQVGRATPLWGALSEEIKAFGAQLVVIDTLADAFGGNENFRSQARSFIGQLRGLANAINGAVILTAHPSVAGQASGTGLSGSTAWNNSVRSRIYLTRPKADDGDQDDNARILKRVKANYASASDQLKLRYGNGVLVADTAAGLEWMTHDRADAAFLVALRALKAEGRSVSHSPGANFAPKIMAGRPETKGFNKPDLTQAMNRLLQAGRIRGNMEVGRKPNRHPLIGLGEVAASGAPDWKDAA